MKAREGWVTVLDFETTGSVRGWAEEPWQIGVVEVREGRVTGRMEDSWLRVAEGRPFNRYAPGRWAEVRGELAGADTLGSGWGRWREWLSPPRWIAAHHAATEKGVLSRAAPMHRAAGWIDTLALARAALPGLGEWHLERVAEATGAAERARALVPGRTWHDALFDAAATAFFLEWLLEQEGWNEMELEALENVR